MADLDEARDEIREFLTDAAAQDPTLVGLVYLARTLDEQLDSIDTRLNETNRLLETLLEAVRACVPPR